MIKCIGYLTDPHIPFHDRRALASALNCLADSKLHALILGGDIFDMYWAHGHGSKHPGVLSSFDSERQEGVNFLDLLDQTFGDIPKHFVEGNHEYRFERWLVEHAPQLFGFTEMRSLLEMQRRKNWSYYDYGPTQLMQVEKTNLFIKHAPRGSTGTAILNQAACNLMFGHIHRIIQEKKTTADGRIIQAVSPGWLGDKRFDKVFGYVPGHHNWQQGFARIWIDSESWQFSIEVIEIKPDQSCFASGKLYRG